jgi:ABC-type transport system involved in multi-copper enzyme maturation permease subunit
MKIHYSYNWIVPLWIVVVGLIAGFALLWLAALLLRTIAPRTAAVAAATAKECRSQPLFLAILGFGFVLILLSAFIPYSTFGDDIKVMKDTALMSILVLSIILAVSSSSTSIADELEGRTALTVLSKPIGRRQFVLGKLLGVLTPVVMTYLILGAFFLCVTSYKVKFEAREMALPPPTWQRCQIEMLGSVPALALAFLETVMITSISVAASVRLAMIPNLLICATVYVVGHMMPLIVQSAVGKLPIVAFVGQFLSTVLPVLEHFNIQAAIASGRDAAMSLADWGVYLGWAAGYALLYSGIMLLVALLLFEDRDLA